MMRKFLCLCVKTLIFAFNKLIWTTTVLNLATAMSGATVVSCIEWLSVFSIGNLVKTSKFDKNVNIFKIELQSLFKAVT